VKKTEIKKLDDLWSKKVKGIGICEMCGRRDYLNAHHIYSRSNRSVRWDLNNGICLCSGHHTLCNDSAHKAPADFIDWVKDYRGKEWWEKLVKAKNEINKFQDYETIKEELV
jgi:hypothetical protein